MISPAWDGVRVPLPPAGVQRARGAHLNYVYKDELHLWGILISSFSLDVKIHG